jgi:hypothetical protein
VWSLSLPLLLLLLSATFGHALVARMLDPEAARRHLLQRAMVDSVEYPHAALGVLVVLVGAVFVRRTLASFRTAEPRPLPAWRLAAVPPLVFLLQEHVERLVQDGDFSWLTAAEPAVLAGVALKIPCGLFALWLVRTLLRAADEIGCALARRSASAERRLAASRLSLLVHASPLRLRVLASRHAGRAPPAFA